MTHLCEHDHNVPRDFTVLDPELSTHFILLPPAEAMTGRTGWKLLNLLDQPQQMSVVVFQPCMQKS